MSALSSSLLDQYGADLLEVLPDPLVVVDSQGLVLYINPAAESLTGYAASELLGESVTRLIPQPTRQRVDVVTWLTRWAGKRDPEELQYLHLTGLTASGVEMQLSVRVSSLILPTGPVYPIIFRDVSLELKTQAELKHNNLLAARIMAISEDAILTLDEELLIRYWNRKAEETFGYKEDEVSGKPVNMLIPLDLHKQHDIHINGFRHGKQPSRLMGDRGEITGRHKDGRLLTLEASITKTTIDGKVILSAHLRDISRRKLAESALIDSELRFRAIFDQAVDIMLLLNNSGTVIELNQRATDILGQRNLNIGKPCWMLDWWGSAQAGGLEADRDNLRQQIISAAQGEILHTEMHIPGADSQRVFDLALMPVKDSSGTVAFVIAEGREITALLEHFSRG